MNYSKMKKSELIDLLNSQDKELSDFKKEVESLEWSIDNEYTRNDELEDHQEDLDLINELREAKKNSEFSEYEKERLYNLLENL